VTVVESRVGDARMALLDSLSQPRASALSDRE
jgi:hypothetical protein